jgi:electron transport complex protein RnfG
VTEVELTISGRRKEPGAFRLAFTLALAGMLSGLGLASAYQITKPTIDANKARELRLGVFRVVPGSSRLRMLALRDGALVPIDVEERPGEASVYAAFDEAGAFMGYAIVGSGPGFQDTIGVLYGYEPSERLVIGMHILQSRETPGLGDKIFKDEDFIANFADLSIEPEIILTKKGRSAPNEVDAITGATISSAAVVKIINAANERWLELLPAPGEVPPPSPPAEVEADGAGEGGEP